MLLLDDLKVRLSEGLGRRASTTCSKWAERYITLGKPMPGPLRFDKHPWSREWFDYTGDWDGMKGAQMAMTMAGLARAIFTVDIRRIDVLYVLPKKTDAADFSKSKFDTLLEESPKLMALFSNVRNVGHKQAGSVNLFIRGSRSRSQLKAVSTGLMIFDEYDEHMQKNVALAIHRQTGYEQADRQRIRYTTPTIPDFGIAKEMKSTTYEQWTYCCPLCGRLTTLQFPDCLVVDDEIPDRSHLRCLDCKRPLTHETKRIWLGEKSASWVPTQQGTHRGFQISKLYSMVEEPAQIAKRVILGRTDDSYATEVHNSDMGLPYAAPGSRVSEQEVEACTKAHRITDAPKTGLITLGCDVGQKVLFVTIDRWILPPNAGPSLNTYAIPITMYAAVLNDFADLDPLMRAYNIVHAVVDVDPEFRSAAAFAERFPGHVNLCRFVRTQSRRSITVEEDNLVLHVNRTYWLDISQQRFKQKRIHLPQDLPKLYAPHIAALVKHTKREDSTPDQSNIVSRYISTGADHFAFSRVYSEIALPMAASIVEAKDIKDFL